jgi:hypothetical protein
MNKEPRTLHNFLLIHFRVFFGIDSFIWKDHNSIIALETLKQCTIIRIKELKFKIENNKIRIKELSNLMITCQNNIQKAFNIIKQLKKENSQNIIKKVIFKFNLKDNREVKASNEVKKKECEKYISYFTSTSLLIQQKLALFDIDELITNDQIDEFEKLLEFLNNEEFCNNLKREYKEYKKRNGVMSFKDYMKNKSLNLTNK